MEASRTKGAADLEQGPQITVVEKRTTTTPVSSHREDGIGEQVNERRLLTKIDLHIVPVLTLMFVFAFLDRINVGNAVVFGMEEDLDMAGTQYNVALAIFFVPYILFELPWNLLLRHTKPSWMLTAFALLFGLVTLLQGLVNNYAGLLACRFFLGVFEAGFLPGALYLLGLWYKREEAQKRFSFVFLATAVAGAFGGLLASGIGKLDNTNGWRAWRWIFILEGVITCAISLPCLLAQPNFPDQVSWLSEAEKKVLRKRLAEDLGHDDSHEPVTGKLLFEVLSDYRILAGGFMYLGFTVSAYGYSFFAPTIIASFGYGPIQTNLRSVPVWVVAFVVAMIVASISDRIRRRYYPMLAAAALGLVGYAMLLGVQHKTHLEYGAMFLAMSGTLSGMPILLCWFGTNIKGHTRRAVGVAWQVGCGNIGGIVATFIYRTGHGSSVVPGYATTMGFFGLAVVASTVYYVGVRRENCRRRREADVDSNPDHRESQMKLYT